MKLKRVPRLWCARLGLLPLDANRPPPQASVASLVRPKPMATRRSLPTPCALRIDPR